MLRRRSILEHVAVAVCAVAVALLVQAYLVKPYRIPSESMAATLVPRDRVLVNRLVYDVSQPKRGDIVVIDSKAVGRILIKRIVGLPGDTLALRGGHVYVDGRRLEEPYVRRLDGRAEPTEPFLGTGEPWALEQPYTVPPGHYFLMGDNRTVSDDSRDWGPAPRSEIVGRAFFTYWPLTRLGGL
jgi:signal peptidase I